MNLRGLGSILPKSNYEEKEKSQLYRSKSEAESQFLPMVYPRTNLVSARDTRNGPRDLVPIME
jgi:hypothetical protein